MHLLFESAADVAPTAVDGRLGKVRVFLDEKVTVIPEYQGTVISNWKNALEQTLEARNVFNEKSSNYFTITATVLEIDVGLISSVLQLSAEYKVSKNGGEDVYKKIIKTQGVASDFYGWARFNNQMNMAAQENIRQFAYDFSKTARP